jgi:hypothetical protein
MSSDFVMYNEIVTYLTNVDRRIYQSLNKESRKLLFMTIDSLHFSDELSSEKMQLLLNWIQSNRLLLVGIKKIKIDRFIQINISNIFETLSLLDYPNIYEISMDITNDYTLTNNNYRDIQIVFEKMINIKRLIINRKFILGISNIQFPYIDYFELNGSIEEENYKRCFETFILNNSWKYLKHLSIDQCTTNEFQNIYLIISSLKILELYHCHIDLTQKQKQKQQKQKQKQQQKLKLKKLIISPDDMDDIVYYQLLKLLITNSLIELYIDRINDDILLYISKTCISLQKLEIDDSEFTRNGFSKFLREQELYALKYLNMNFEQLTKINLKKIFKKIEMITCDAYSRLNELQTITFLQSTNEINGIGLRSDADILSIIPYFNNQNKKLRIYDPLLNVSKFVLIMNTIKLQQMTEIVMTIDFFPYVIISSYLSRLINIKKISLHMIMFDENNITLEMIIMEIVQFINLIKTLKIYNQSIEEIDIITNLDNTKIEIPNHDNEMNLLKKYHFPNLKHIRLGWWD